ncbi:copia protein, partial [Suillus placidus]
AMLSEVGLLKKFWGDATLHAANIINRVLTRALKDNITPFKAFTGDKPSVSHLRIFRCKAFVHVPDECHQKFDAKSIKYKLHTNL